MALTTESLKSPKGEFTIDMFPALNGDMNGFDTLLLGFIAQGNAKATEVQAASADRDRVALAWAKYTAALSVYNRLLTSPMSVTFESQGQGSYGAAQLKLWGEKVAALRTEFDLVATPQPAEIPSNFSPSGHVKHRVDW